MPLAGPISLAGIGLGEGMQPKALVTEGTPVNRSTDPQINIELEN
jgi:hypothetical protein